MHQRKAVKKISQSQLEGRRKEVRSRVIWLKTENNVHVIKEAMVLGGL